MQGIAENKLNLAQWQRVEERMSTEEAACALTTDGDENG